MVTRHVVFSAQPSASRANLALMERLAWVQRLQTVAQAGLTYTRDPSIDSATSSCKSWRRKSPPAWRSQATNRGSS